MQGFYVWDLNKKAADILRRTGVDFVWVHSGDDDQIAKLKANGIKIFYSQGAFVAQNKEEKEKYAAISKSGKRVKGYAGWYVGLCPSNNKLRQERFKKIRSIFDNPLYDGVYLDSIRYPTFWETKEPEYLNTCYCSECLTLSKKAKKQGLNWFEFRIKQISSFFNAVCALKKSKKLGYFAVPETQENLYNVFAQPYAIFHDKVDYVSPMIYPQMVGKNLEWAKQTVLNFQQHFGKEKTIPITQVIKMPEDSKDRFDENDAIKLSQAVKSLGNIGYFMLDQIVNDFTFTKKLTKH
jgi:hypothetical protein